MTYGYNWPQSLEAVSKYREGCTGSWSQKWDGIEALQKIEWGKKMSKNSRFNEDFSYIMLIVSLLTVFSVLFIKLTYLVALPYYKVITNLFSEKVSQSEAQKFKYWMRFLPVGWFVDINSIEDNKRIKNASVTLSFLPIALIVYLITAPLTYDASSDSIIWVISFIFLCFTIGSVIGFYKNFKFTKNTKDYHKNMYWIINIK